MATLKTLVADSREFGGPVIQIPGRKTPYTYSDFAPNVWKSGNLFGHYGVHPGAEVTVVAGPKEQDGGTSGADDSVGRFDSADPIFAILGATLVGATVRLQPVEPVDSRALVCPAAWVDRYETAPSCSIIAYGGPPEDAAISHFETEMWSENPTEPPESVAADDPALRSPDGTYSHDNLLDVATAIAGEYDLGSNDRVVLDAPLTEPGALVAGVLTPLSVGATLSIAGDDGTRAGDLVVTSETENQQENTMQVRTVTERLRDTRRA
ncbi:hypothetical protein [Halobacteriaceae bacterium SHR40]|uniref:hypothetical protein n=1 Tax=Halovenus amylolytica TaxID=2500550 RepID=UPI000FE383CD